MKDRKLKPGMSFDEYWAYNKSSLMLSKMTSEELSRIVWNDLIQIYEQRIGN